MLLLMIFNHYNLLNNIVFAGGDRVGHAQILPTQNNGHAGQEVLLRPRHNRSVHYHLTLKNDTVTVSDNFLVILL